MATLRQQTSKAGLLVGAPQALWGKGPGLALAPARRDQSDRITWFEDLTGTEKEAGQHLLILPHIDVLQLLIHPEFCFQQHTMDCYAIP